MNEILYKVRQGKELKERELRELVINGNVIEVKKIGNNRMTREIMRTIVDAGGEYFAIVWNKVLIKDKENEYPNQLERVKKRTEKVVSTVTHWDVVKE
jgi:hypothetical protein